MIIEKIIEICITSCIVAIFFIILLKKITKVHRVYGVKS
jgi:hypothetical protein